jgi:hypothetical protein
VPELERFFGQKRAEAIANQVIPFIGSQAHIRTVTEWREFFERHHSKVLDSHPFRNHWVSNGFYQHTLFVLDNTKDGQPPIRSTD